MKKNNTLFGLHGPAAGANRAGYEDADTTVDRDLNNMQSILFCFLN